MPAIVPFIPLIASGIGAASSIFSGIQASRQNAQNQARADQSTAAQQALISQMMSGISPDAYRAQAALDGQSALSQLASNFAQRGMLSSGALHTQGANTLAQLYANASAKYQQDRMNAYGMALNGQQAIQRQYAGQINPNPYEGLGASLGGLGTAAGQYLYGRYATPTPNPGAYGGGLPGFGVRGTYPTLPVTPY